MLAPNAAPAKDHSPDAADRALFRFAMRHVRPLPDRGPRARALPLRTLPESWLQARRAHAQDSPGQRGGHRPSASPANAPAPPSLRAFSAYDPDATAYLQPGCGPDVLRGLRRGKWPIQATLDLHGSTLEQAMERLDRFLGSCQAHAIRCVRIVHGKGMGSRNRTPILKTAVRQHLCRLSSVQAWTQCAERDGGAGAVTALLRRPEPSQ